MDPWSGVMFFSSILRQEQHPLPETGLAKGVCVDVIDLGYVETAYGIKEKALIIWEINQDHPELPGPFRVNKRYTLSLHEKANLSKDLEGWRGKAFTNEERKGFELDDLKGKGCYLSLVHNTSDKTGIVYCNVSSITAAKREEWIAPSGLYERKEQTAPTPAPAPQPAPSMALVADDDLPF